MPALALWGSFANVLVSLLQVPPDVPKRTSSITPLPGVGQGLQGLQARTSLSSLPGRLGGGSLGGDCGSITSVHSSGSDSSSHTATASAGCDQLCDQRCDEGPGRSTSPLWKRKEQQECSGSPSLGMQVHQGLQGQLQVQAMQAQQVQAMQQVQGSPAFNSHMQEPQHVMYKVGILNVIVVSCCGIVSIVFHV